MYDITRRIPEAAVAYEAMRRPLLTILLLLLLAVSSLMEIGCETRVTRRSGIGDPLHPKHPAETPRNVVGQKYDDGEFEQR